MTKLQTLKNKLLLCEATLESKQGNLEELERSQSNIELDNDDFISQYENMLDEIEGEFMNMNASYILKECDPTAYRCGLNDYVDAHGDVTETEEYQDLQSDIETLESEIGDFEIEIEDLEQQIEDFEDLE